MRGPAVRPELTERRALCAHLLRRHLGRELRLVDLEVAGEAVQAQAFGGGSPAGAAPPAKPARRVRYEHLPGFSRHDPRLGVIQRSLQRALRLGHFRHDGAALPVDGFRLRELDQWARYHVCTLAE